MIKYLIAAFLLLLGPTAPDAATAPSRRDDSAGQSFVSSKIRDRLTKEFDFDERAIGNYESMPAGWRQLNAIRYPRFLEPKFDMNVGHDAPPSFMLPLTGGSLACYYLAGDISIHPDCDYEITGWIKPSKLHRARAFIKVYFLDHALNKINESERRSADVHGSGKDEPWTQVTIEIPAGFELARWIGLSVHVEQADAPVADPDHPRPIDYQDIHATAWFDDIRIVRRPRATLSMKAVGNVFPADTPVECLAGVSDLDGRGLQADLELTNADGRMLSSRKMQIGKLRARPETICFDDLPPGLYSLRLNVRSDGKTLLDRLQKFVRLGDVPTDKSDSLTGFGVITDPAAPSHGKISARLTRLLGVQAARIPLWREGMRDEDIVTGDPAADALVRTLRRAGIQTVGTLDRPPPSLLEQFGHPGHSVFDVLSASPDQWRPYLSFLLARYGEEVNAWQIGRTPPDPLAGANTLNAALTHLKAELKPLVGSPRIIIPKDAGVAWPDASGPSAMPDVFSVNVPAHFTADQLVDQLTRPQGKDQPALWVTLDDLDSARFDRIARLSQIARRLILARVAGAEMVFMPQPWLISQSSSEGVVPDESFIVLSTIARILGDRRPIAPIWLDHGVTGWYFGDSDSTNGVLAAWTDGRSRAPGVVMTDAVPQSRHYDLWLNELNPEQGSTGRACRFDVTPSFLTGAEAGRVLTMSSFALEPPSVRVQLEKNKTTLRIKNHYDVRLSGILKFDPPAFWRMTPESVALDVGPGEEARFDLYIQLPSNHSIGPHTFAARLSREGGDIVFRAPVEVVCPGLDVSVLARAEEGSLHIIQRLTNRSGHPLNLRSSLLYQEDRRQTRVILSLGDGESTLREFRIEDGAKVRNHPIRICTESISGDLKCNQVLKFD